MPTNNNTMVDIKAIQVQRQATFDKYKTLYKSEKDGKLPPNSVFQQLFDKVTTQYVIDTFSYENKIVDRYMKASMMIGGVDEILDVEFANLDQYSKSREWWKEESVNKVNPQWAAITWEDRYWYTIYYDQMARVFTEMGYFSSVITQIKLSIPKRKTYEWYARIINLHKQYTNVVEIEVPADMSPKEEIEYIAKKVTLISREMSLPNSKYNERGRVNATPYEQQRLTWNVQYHNEFSWLSATLFAGNTIGGMGQEVILNSEFVDYSFDRDESGNITVDEDGENIVCVIDTDNAIYLGQKYTLAGSEPMIAVRRENFYVHEIYTSVIVASENKVIVKKKSVA